MVGLKRQRNYEKKRKPAWDRIKNQNITFWFSRRIYKIVEKLTSVQLSNCWNELEAVLKNYPNRDKPQSSIFYFNYYNVIKILKKNLKHWKTFIITTFWIIAGKNYQILGQILCPKTLELKIFEVKKCSESFFCCKYIFEVLEIIYKREQMQIVLKFIFYCERSSLVGKIHRTY